MWSPVSRQKIKVSNRNVKIRAQKKQTKKTGTNNYFLSDQALNSGGRILNSFH